MISVLCIARFDEHQGPAREVFTRLAERTARHYGGLMVALDAPAIVAWLEPDASWVSIVRFPDPSNARRWYDQEVRQALREACDPQDLPSVVIVREQGGGGQARMPSTGLPAGKKAESDE